MTFSSLNIRLERCNDLQLSSVPYTYPHTDTSPLPITIKMIKDTLQFMEESRLRKGRQTICIIKSIQYFIFCRKQEVTEEMHKAIATQENKILFRGTA